ncbi:chemoreceptor glutamine deamidase CheD [Shewanella sp. TC10]|uniref:chemoreceptor glutamine deamidase CheD n=1 Tax=Shewanella sp. TC10 TaxID=1419739 RepID=UPI00129E513D|nr:chemoreceptor glutamine deamidase CheD [Shewanella sp. TC10]
MSFDGQDEYRNDIANRYYDRYFDIEAVKILPGEYFATTDNTMIVTVLGSCVSVCLRDPVKNIGGMNHFLLPSDSDFSIPSVSQSARYGVFAMELLINQMLKFGADKRHIEAKVFGGGNVMKGFTSSSVGERNAEFAVDYLKTEHIPIIASDLLDNYPRKVYFFPHTGRVEVKKIKSMHNSTIMDRESEYRMRIRGGDIDSSVDFFE